jgi:ADP-ribose pyrophosphatase
VKVIKTVALTDSPWIIPRRVIYENDYGETLEWDFIERIHSRQTVVVMARFKKSGDLLLIRQYRVIFDRYVIGLPAGIVDEEDIEVCALRELREETGYTGKVVQVSPPLTSNSALIRELSQCVVVEIPEDAIAESQELEPSEIIEVHRVRRDRLQEFFRQAVERGDLIGAGLWYLLAATEHLSGGQKARPNRCGD